MTMMNQELPNPASDTGELHGGEMLRALWDAKALEWHQQVGEEGDTNRIYNSDPVLWRFLGDVEGLSVLDAGCGTGYLSVKLARRGARVVGVDHSPAMVDVAQGRAREEGLDLRFHVDSCSSMASLADESFDRIVSNYVLMDLPDLAGAVASFHRVLRTGGRAVVIMLHPCFMAPNGGIGRMLDGSIIFRWDRSYFDERAFREEWGHFTTPFVTFHRPLSTYWKTFRAAGFTILDFDEPVVSDPPPPELDPATARRQRMYPNSVAFLLEKGGEGEVQNST